MVIVTVIEHSRQRDLDLKISYNKMGFQKKKLNWDVFSRDGFPNLNYLKGGEPQGGGGSDDGLRIVDLHGVDGLRIVDLHGVDGLRIVDLHGDDGLRIVDLHGDDGLRVEYNWSLKDGLRDGHYVALFKKIQGILKL